MPKKSSDLEFHVSDEGGTASTVFHDFDKACGFAVSRACSSGLAMQVDVVTWTRTAARMWGGENAAEVYDPDASVHERIVVKAEAQGRRA
jgi:hypothetical protein